MQSEDWYCVLYILYTFCFISVLLWEIESSGTSILSLRETHNVYITSCKLRSGTGNLSVSVFTVLGGNQFMN